MKIYLKSVLVHTFLIIFSFATTTQSQVNKMVTVDQVVVPVVTLTDKRLINFLLDEFMILTQEPVTKMEIIDATSNGFGEDDLIKLYPSNEIYFPAPSDTAQKIMNKWKFTANFRKDAIDEKPEYFESLPTHKAENGIFASLLRGLKYNFNGVSIKIRFEKDSSGVATFEMWGYKEGDLQHLDRSSSISDSVSGLDVLQVVKKDTLILPPEKEINAIYIFKTVKDTIVLGGTKPNK